MNAPYVPASAHELIGYLASVIKQAAKDHPGDKDIARGLAVYEAWEAAQGWDAPATEDGAL